MAMKKSTKIIVTSISLAVASLISAPTANAQQKWGLEQCINYAIDNNLEIRSMATNVELAHLDKLQSAWSYSPSVNGSVGYNANFGRSLDPTTYNFIENKTVSNVNGSLNLNATLFAGMGKLHTLKRSELNFLAAVEGLKVTKNYIMIAVAGGYLDMLNSLELVKNSQNQIELIQEQIGRTEKLVEAGSVALGALMELKSQKATEEYTLVSRQNAYTIAKLTLTQLLELRDHSADQFDIEIPDIEHLLDEGPSVSIEDINEQAQELPQIEQAKLTLQAAEKAIDVARARLYPSLSLGVYYGSSYSDARTKPQLNQGGALEYLPYPFGEQFRDNASAAIQLSMSIPIFNGLTAQRNVKIAKVQHYQKQVALSIERNKLYKEIHQAYADAVGALERYHSAKSGVESAEEAFRYAESKFAAGATNFVDYNVQKNNLMNAQSMMIQSKWEYVFKMKILDYYQSIPITL